MRISNLLLAPTLLSSLLCAEIYTIQLNATLDYKVSQKLSSELKRKQIQTTQSTRDDGSYVLHTGKYFNRETAKIELSRIQQIIPTAFIKTIPEEHKVEVATVESIFTPVIEVEKAEPAIETPKIEEPRVEVAKAEQIVKSRVEIAKIEPVIGPQKIEEPKIDEPKVEIVKTEPIVVPVVETAKVEPAIEAPKIGEPKVEVEVAKIETTRDMSLKQEPKVTLDKQVAPSISTVPYSQTDDPCVYKYNCGVSIKDVINPSDTKCKFITIKYNCTDPV